MAKDECLITEIMNEVLNFLENIPKSKKLIFINTGIYERYGDIINDSFQEYYMLKDILQIRL